MSRNSAEEDDEEFLHFGDDNTPSNFQPTQSSSHPAGGAGPNPSPANTNAAQNHPLFTNGGTHHFSSPMPPHARRQTTSNVPVRQPGDLFSLPYGSLRNSGRPLPNLQPDPIAANWNLSAIYPWTAGLETSPIGGQNPPLRFTSWAHLPGNGAPWRSLAPRPAQNMENAATTTTAPNNEIDQQAPASGMGFQLEHFLNDPSIVWNSTGGEEGDLENEETGEENQGDGDNDEDFGFTIDREILDILNEYADWEFE